MKQLNSVQGVFGPFSSIQTLEDRYICDGMDFQFDVIGDAVIEDYVVQPASSQSIDAAKVKKNQQINEWRLAANQTSFPHSGKSIACDALSRSDIDAVANSISLSGSFPVGFPGAWKAIDNTYVMLPDVDAFKALHASMTLQGTINFGKSQTLKTQLAAATTLDQINSITWD